MRPSKDNPPLNDIDKSEIIAMAWADEISFDAIYERRGLTEADAIALMRSQLKPSSFRLWRKRVSGRKSKHQMLLRGKARKETGSKHTQMDQDDDFAV